MMPVDRENEAGSLFQRQGNAYQNGSGMHYPVFGINFLLHSLGQLASYLLN